MNTRQRKSAPRTFGNAGAGALYARERALVAFATVCFVFAFMAYTYFLCVSIVNVVMRQETDTQIRETANQIAALEARFIEAQSKVTKEEAIARGFRDVDEKTYVDRTPESLVLRTNDES